MNARSFNHVNISRYIIYLTGSNNKNSRVVGKDNETVVSTNTLVEQRTVKFPQRDICTCENLLLVEDPLTSRSRIAVGSRNFFEFCCARQEEESSCVSVTI